MGENVFIEEWRIRKVAPGRPTGNDFLMTAAGFASTVILHCGHRGNHNHILQSEDSKS
jgi:hypothetical protein